MTGLTCASVSTMSPITMEALPEPVNEAQDVSPSAGVIRTLPEDTARSERGTETLKTPSFSFQEPLAPVSLPIVAASGRPAAPTGRERTRRRTATSTHRVIEILPSDPEQDPFRESRCVSLFHRKCEQESARQADHAGNEKRNGRCDFPEKPASERRGCDRGAANEVIQPDGSRADVRPREVDDHGLSRGLADLAKPPDHERGHEPEKAPREHDGQREGRETEEGGDDEGLPSCAVGDLRSGDVDQDRRRHLHGDECPVAGRAHAHDVRRIKNQKDVDQALARPDENVREEEPLEWRGQGPPDSPDPGRRLFSYEWDADSRHHRERHERQRKCRDEAQANAASNSIPGDRKPSEGRRDDDRKPSQNGLHGEPDRPTLPGKRVPDDREERRARHARPRHDEDETRENEQPGGSERVDAVPDKRETDEEEQRASPAVAVGDPASRILVSAVQEIPDRPEEADREHRRAQGLEIFRDEALPQVLPQPEQKHGGADRADVALETEVIGKTSEATANGFHPPARAQSRVGEKASRTTGSRPPFESEVLLEPGRSITADITLAVAILTDQVLYQSIIWLARREGSQLRAGRYPGI